MLLKLLVLVAGPFAGLAAIMAAENFARGDAAASGLMPHWRELLAGALAGTALGVLSTVAAPAGTLLFTVLLAWLLLALAWIDFRTRILPDALNVCVLLLGGLMVILTRPTAWPHHLAGAVAGFGILWLVETLYLRLRGIDGLGRGDAKLLGALGIWVTWAGIAPVLLIASLAGICAALVQAALRREPLTASTAIAFGPWIALGGWIVWLASPLLMPLVRA